MTYLGNQAINFWDTTGIVRVNPQTITQNIVLSSGWNGSSVGTVTIASGVSVTVASGARWVIL